jgi:NAD(P)-dependent dehydrogenase (short-subunit alcohol dehydrogenase family)
MAGARVSAKAVIVTGGAGGMGSAATELLAARGVNVLCADRNDDALAETAAKVAGLAGRVTTVAVDIGDPDAVRGMVDRALAEWGGFDGVFNIAGYEGSLAPIVDTTIDEFDEVLRSNIRGTWLSMKFALPHLVERGGGVIVNTGSYQALHGKANCAAYSGAKHAIVGMTKSIALEYATRNVRASVVCPGAMDTRMIRTMFERLAPGDPEKGERAVVADIPQARMAEPEELAATGIWLLLDAPTHITGQVIAVDGGKSAA